MVKSNEELLNLIKLSYPQFNTQINLASYGRKVSAGLKMEDAHGTNICALLGFWLGSGFYKDPLYPWIHDVIVEHKSPSDRSHALYEYAIHRLKKQIATLEKRQKLES